jgi:hypothetical protein
VGNGRAPWPSGELPNEWRSLLRGPTQRQAALPSLSLLRCPTAYQVDRPRAMGVRPYPASRTTRAKSSLISSTCADYPHQTKLNSDIDIKILLSKVDSPERSNIGRTTKTKRAKSGVCSRRINFGKQYLYINIGVKSRGKVHHGRVASCHSGAASQPRIHNFLNITSEDNDVQQISCLKYFESNRFSSECTMAG